GRAKKPAPNHPSVEGYRITRRSCVDGAAAPNPAPHHNAYRDVEGTHGLPSPVAPVSVAGAGRSDGGRQFARTRGSPAVATERAVGSARGRSRSPASPPWTTIAISEAGGAALVPIVRRRSSAAQRPGPTGDRRGRFARFGRVVAAHRRGLS